MIVLTLPWPPSLNNYRAVCRGRLITSKAGRAYHADVMARVVEQHGILEPMGGRLRVYAVTHAPNNRAFDLDNRWKAVLDAIKEARVIQDDSQIDELTMVRGAVGGSIIIVKVEEMHSFSGWQLACSERSATGQPAKG